MILSRQIDDLANNIEEIEFNKATSWLDMFKKKKDSPRVAGLKRQLKKVEKGVDTAGRTCVNKSSGILDTQKQSANGSLLI